MPDIFGIAIDPEQIKALVENGISVDDMFYLEDFNNRKLWLNSDIDDDSVSGIVRNIVKFNRDDKGKKPEDRQPIILYVNSCGGEVDAGYELIDIIKSSKTPVYTVNLGHWYSMGFMIGLAGHKRYATTNAKFLMHDGQSFVYDSSTKAQDRMRFQLSADERTKNFVLDNSVLEASEYDDKLRVEWYLFADEAKKYGFVDYIIGVDCDFDEVI